jgi:predicted O-linked N-acetylglucosamine transferase (SPINDLY family)
LALALARDPARLRQLREKLAANRDQCTLFDSATYTRDLEALFARMVERHTAGLPPDHLLI